MCEKQEITAIKTSKESHFIGKNTFTKIHQI